MIYKKPFSKYRSIWIETTEDSHDHGGKGWEYGKCLWSPTTDKSGKKIYELMKQPKENDLVIHFHLHHSKKYKKLKSGEFKETVKSTRFIDGYSYVASQCIETKKEPPASGNWSGRSGYYRINLKGYSGFEPGGVDLRILTTKFDNEIRAEIIEDSPSYYPFIVYKNEIRLAQGKYLTSCTEKLFNQLSEIQSIHETSWKYILETGDTEKEFFLQDVIDHSQDDYIEGKRKKRESYFFVRNPKLAKQVKEQRGYVCEACGFDFKLKYGDRGEKYIECHHENPLSERSEKEWNENLNTSVNDVKLLCSNCHRMIHRTRPAMKFEDLKKIIKN